MGVEGGGGGGGGGDGTVSGEALLLLCAAAACFFPPAPDLRADRRAHQQSRTTKGRNQEGEEAPMILDLRS